MFFLQKIQINHNDQVQIVHRKDHPGSGKCFFLDTKKDFHVALLHR